MPKRQLSYRDPNYTPKMTRHATGQAVVRLSGKDHYLGRYGTKEATVAYHRLVAEWKEKERKPIQAPLPSPVGNSMNELLLAYVRHATAHYVRDGEPTAELDCIKSACRPVKELFGETLVRDFGPLKAKSVREWMIKADWSRGFINRCMGRIKRMLRWGVENELVPPDVYAGVKEISGLQIGRTTARETPGRHPVSQDHIDKVKGIVRQRTRDLIDLMLLSAARPGELLSLTGRMIDRTGEVWVARLEKHKTMHQGKTRALFFGPQAQLILRRYIHKNPDARLFKQKSFRTALRNACKKLNIPIFTAHWLRHTAATRIRAEFDVETAQVLLGHSHLNTTEIYAKQDHARAVEVAKRVG